MLANLVSPHVSMLDLRYSREAILSTLREEGKAAAAQVPGKGGLFGRGSYCKGTTAFRRQKKHLGVRSRGQTDPYLERCYPSMKMKLRNREQLKTEGFHTQGVGVLALRDSLRGGGHCWRVSLRWESGMLRPEGRGGSAQHARGWCSRSRWI